MIEEKHEVKSYVKSYVKTEKVLVSQKRYCDVCEKEITGHYWKVTQHHYDWGNDSCESLEYKDVCSPTCLYQLFDKYVPESDNSFNTKHFEVAHKRWCEARGDIKLEEPADV